MHQPRSRRAVLASLGGLTTVAGCLDSAETDSTATETVQPSTATATTESTTADETTTEESLDLREANVVSVAIEQDADGTRFDVTLYHNDAGEAGYANWWQVEKRDGTRLGRRELGHAHGTRKFTRSATIDVSEAACVVVRGHDQTHAYGGRAMLVALDSGATAAIDQGTGRQALDGRDCP